MNKVIDITGNEVEDFYPGLFANALKVQNVNSLIANVGAVAPEVYLSEAINGDAGNDRRTYAIEGKESR